MKSNDFYYRRGRTVQNYHEVHVKRLLLYNKRKPLGPISERKLVRFAVNTLPH